ncbi:MAG TPA: acyl-CoA thioesterase [Sphingomonas sp.]|jgi:acyl-CoA thioester hydrolase|uniref:acyl-CoA thioesterase n=1 Tax=Sphingomonas sp. TaxID=28214 RepID=UPI002ED8DF9D
MATSFLLPITALPDDIDELGHVNNAVWVRWIQDVATAHWHAVAAPGHHDAYVWLITRHEIDYLRALKAGETVTARTWVADAPRGAKFDRLMEFTGGDGKVHVRARTTWAILDRTTGRPLRVPAEVIAPFLA